MSLHVNEWPQSIIHLMSGKTIRTAIMIRELTGCTMIPSPAPEAHARLKDYDPSESGKRSRHNVGKLGVLRKSDGTDIFLSNNQVSEFWLKAQACPDLGGFGLYFDTELGGKKRVMAHIDNRPYRMLWLCPDQESREYIYYHKDPVRFLRALADEFEKIAD